MKTNRLYRSVAIVLVASMLAVGLGTPTRAAHPHRSLVNITLQLKWVNQAEFVEYTCQIRTHFGARPFARTDE